MARDVTLLIGRDEGLFRMQSSDGGATWGTPEVVLADVESHVIKRTNSGAVYLGTRGHGLFRAKAGLQEWTPIETPAAAMKIRSICPVGDRLVIGIEAGLGDASPAVGIHEWTEKGGWRQLGDVTACSGSKEWFYPVPTEGVHARWVSVDPRNEDRIFAAMQVGSIAISNDGGESWTDRRELDSPDVHMVEPNHTHPGVVYAGAGGNTSGFYRSKDNGETWESLAQDCGTFVVQFALHPTDPDCIYLGAARGHARDWNRPDTGRGRGEIFRSNDGGDTWRKLGGGLPELMESRINAIHIDAAEPTSIYFGGGLPAGQQNPGIARDAGVYQSLDAGENWRQIMPMGKGEPLALLAIHD